MKKLTPVFVVERIEPCLDFWTGRLGFEKTVEIPEANGLGFVILSRGNVEIMYQSRESLEKDMPALAKAVSGAASPNAMFVEVSDIDDVERRLAGVGRHRPEANDLLRDDRDRRPGAGRELDRLRPAGSTRAALRSESNPAVRGFSSGP